MPLTGSAQTGKAASPLPSQSRAVSRPSTYCCRLGDVARVMGQLSGAGFKRLALVTEVEQGS